MVDTRLTRSSSKRDPEEVQHDREAQRPRVQETARGNGQASGGGVAVSFTPSSAEDLPKQRCKKQFVAYWRWSLDDDLASRAQDSTA